MAVRRPSEGGALDIGFDRSEGIDSHGVTVNGRVDGRHVVVFFDGEALTSFDGFDERDRTTGDPLAVFRRRRESLLDTARAMIEADLLQDGWLVVDRAGLERFHPNERSGDGPGSADGPPLPSGG